MSHHLETLLFLKIDPRFCTHQRETSPIQPITTVSLKRIILNPKELRHLPIQNHELHRF